MMKNIPGPLAPPVTKRPSLKITARSYSCTTLIQKNKLNGIVTTISAIERKVNDIAQNAGFSTSPIK